MTSHEKFIVFGDSLSDFGAFHDLTAGVLKQAVPPDSVGFIGWFSNGLPQSAVTADLLDADTQIYAVGGARAVGTRTIAQYVEQNGYDTPEIMLAHPDTAALATDTYLGGQVGRYLADAAADPDLADGAIAAIWIGANDYNGLQNTSPQIVAQTIQDVIGSTLLAASTIAQTGVEKIYLYNLPGPELLPIPTPPGFDQVVDAHNAALAQGVAMLASQNIDAEVVDIHRMAAEIVADPRTFGLNPAYMKLPILLGIGSQPVWDTTSESWIIPANPLVAGVDINRIAFMDYLHPSSATHGILGAFAAASIEDNLVVLGPEDDTWRTGVLDDLVLSDGGDDRIIAGQGQDTVLAGLGDDRASGGVGNDILAGGTGRDTVIGGHGNDVVAGSDGDDFQIGGVGADFLVDGLGSDCLVGASGKDGFLYVEATLLGGNNSEDGGHFRGGSGSDTLYLALNDPTRAAVEAELRHGDSQTIASIGVTTRSIEHYVFVDPGDPAASIKGCALLEAADLWGII